ncbi:Transcription factor TFIIIC, tau55-related protein [Thalictrum thalictroides]|uniref:Transcription factor TFIIIC, tau55-related protein n=1 Tax=Thalictrum thalictroides TaxID=46969 RepID=A0A7J6WC56_THATH|nr:Transcription factor TFIIIC, tau55-related protein [Thalictrum thalictroides]
MDMEDNPNKNENVLEEEEEYVLLDLEAVYGQINIPANTPYVLSGLDTLNPILTIGDNLKLIGEYDETIGTCYVFTETDNSPLEHKETGPSEANLFRGKTIVDPNQAAAKQIKPIASLHKILKFRLLSEFETQADTATFK